jgi:hypothetical protein
MSGETAMAMREEVRVAAVPMLESILVRKTGSLVTEHSCEISAFHLHHPVHNFVQNLHLYFALIIIHTRSPD